MPFVVCASLSQALLSPSTSEGRVDIPEVIEKDIPETLLFRRYL
jgi:hypothetical protein